MTPDTTVSLAEIADTAAELAELRHSALDIVNRAWSVDRSRALLDGPTPAFDDALWATIRELGWPDVLVPEGGGGAGGTLRELAVLTEATGSVAAPLPLAASAAAAWCEGRSADGVALVVPEPARLVGQTVSGTFDGVPYGAFATRLVVLAQTDGEQVVGVVDLAGPGVQRTPVTPLDHGPAAHINLDRAPLQPIARGAAAQRHRDAVMRMRVAQVAEVVGVAAAANHVATEYAKVRVAFDRPIGAFQAIKHRLVNQRAAIEVGRALVNRAADACDHDQPDAEALVSLAAFWAIDSLRAVPEGAMQVFGGIAYTWEHDAHVYLRRATTLIAALGSRAQHRRVVTDWLANRG
ncbi:acyl-CoA dehydrogenase family protein [Mycobacterium shimoidei]|uniref:acyl-CoA dehydrogenase family protein n=1 Tax=Mycobacterium shimoidei TaxID=29313 RepID=UPI00084876E7|nr:acyl-CoA dehydrogenase family protein [Mycobacterium shimoidei]MCV7257214.1 acyl-CoA/acyl-ACP dehydrogenase [Mycobacterium shimoidei]ODR14442.1 acyl-CoA dehydrogenase [Mycobacterium shimoidei]ORW80519.1 acyl-CoA dehydrogenase [Mycobacterium shimoidei]